MKVAFKTLGCKLNFSETSTIKRDFANRKYEITDFDKDADIYVINTCSVTNDANRECRKTVRKALRQNPDAFVAVVGCYAQLEPEEIAEIDGVDVVLGAKEKFDLLDLFDKKFEKQSETLIYHSDVNEAVDFHNAFSSNDRTRAFLKVQDGCDYTCSYCTIPLARGASRSPKVATVVDNAAYLVNKGYKELVLTGVNVGDFGNNRKDDEDFLTLLKALDVIEGLERIRVSSIEPNLLRDDIIDFIAGSQSVMPHIHMPLQSGSDRMLKLMRRRYLTDLYARRVERIKETMPDACVGVDVITGHPGETDELFNETLSFIDSLDISYLHVFTFSERPNTHALNLQPVIDNQERKSRTHKLRRLSDKKRYEYNLQYQGKTRPVLFEEDVQDGYIFGWTDNYIRLGVPYQEGLTNRILPAKLDQVTTQGRVMGHLPENIEKEQSVISELVG